MKKNVTIIIVTAAIIVLVCIFAVFLVADKNKNKDASATTQVTDQKGQNSDKKSETKRVENITIDAPENSISSSKKADKKKSKSDKNSSKKKKSSTKDDKIKKEDKKKKKSSSQKGLPIDWFDE